MDIFSRRAFILTMGAASLPMLSGADEAVSVRDFGARGDGRHDDTAALQKALRSATRIFIPSGIYVVSSTLEVPSNRVLYGEGSRSTIKLRSEQVGRILSSSAGAAASSDIVIRQIRLDGSRVSRNYKEGTDGIFLSRCLRSVVENVQVENCRNNGIVIEYGSGNKVSNNVSIRNGKDGIYLSGTSNCSVDANNCSENGVGGIAVAASNEVMVEGNSCRANRVAGCILGRDASRVTISANEFGPGSPYALFVSAEPIPTPQTLHGKRYPGGQRVYGAYACHITRNRMWGKVALIRFDDGVFSHNIVSDSNSQGVLLQGSKGNKIFENQVSGWNPDFYGIQLADLSKAELPREMAGPIISQNNEIQANTLYTGPLNRLDILDGGRNNSVGRNRVLRAN